MNNRERVFCAVVKTIYDKYVAKDNIDFNSIVFTYAEIEDSFNSLNYGKKFSKKLFNNYRYGHGSKNERVKFIVGAFEEKSLGFYRLAFPKEVETYEEDLDISKHGWKYLSDYDEAQIKAYLRKYYRWIKKHRAEKNNLTDLSPDEIVWVSTALLTYNAYSHQKKHEMEDLFFDKAAIANLAFEMCKEYAKSTYVNAVKKNAVKGIGRSEFLSACKNGRRRLSFKRETKYYAPKLNASLKFSTVNGKKSISAIIKEVNTIVAFLYPTEEEYKALVSAGVANDANICINDSFVKRNPGAVLEYLISEICAEPITYLEFQSAYNKAIANAGLQDEADYVLDKNFQEAVLERKDVISCGHNRFRYYSNMGSNAGVVIPFLGLLKYRNQEISAALLYRENQPIMNAAELNSAYELYDYLRKFSKNFYQEIRFLDELEICIGKASVKDQLLNFITKYGQISRKQLVDDYSLKYGSDKEFIQNRLKEIREYYRDGYYCSNVVNNAKSNVTTDFVYSKSLLSRIQDGEKRVQWQNPNENLIVNISKRFIPEDTEWGVLNNRLIKQFIDCELIGQIELSDDEYALFLKKYIRRHCLEIINHRGQINKLDSLLTVGIVQFAIRNYDGNFWGKLADEIGLNHLNAAQQGKIGNVISSTLIRYGKAFVDENEHVRNILMHAFMFDRFASDYYEYLFQFYNLDLERCISDTCDGEAEYICEAIKNPNSKRQQMLSDYSGLSIYAAPDYCRGIIAASLKAIDNAFWNGSKDVTELPSRLYEQFIAWKNNEKGDFRKAKNTKRGQESYRKYFSSPRIVLNYGNDVEFTLELPKQLLQNNDKTERNLYWKIKTEEQTSEYACRIKEGSFGLRTEEIIIPINEEAIFKKYVCVLVEDGIELRKFTLDEHLICVFDNHGDTVNIENIVGGEYIAFTPSNIEVKSKAIQDSYKIKSLNYYQFVFHEGDIIYVPGEANYYIGNVPERGFSKEGLIENAWVVAGEERVPIYSKVPALIINVEDEKLAGSAIVINGIRIRAAELETVDIKIGNTLDQKYYYFDLTGAAAIKAGINFIDIDIPGSNRGKRLDFVYLNNFRFFFEDAPYINKIRGTLCVNYKVLNKKNIVAEQNAEDQFIDVDFGGLRENVYTTQLLLGNEQYPIEFSVPMLMYSIDRDVWNYEKPEDCWYKDLPDIIYLRYPAKKVKLEIKEDNGEADSFTFEKRLDGTFECDTTKLKSYIGPFHTRKMTHIIKLMDGAKSYDFIRIINHSVFSNVELTADVENEKIIGNFDILGKGSYFADISFKGEKICEKEPLDTENRLTLQTQINTGAYEVTLFEGEEDEDSFDELNYEEVGRISKNLRNPADISGEQLLLKGFTHVLDGKPVSNLAVGKRQKYYIRIERKLDKDSYEGTLIVSYHDKGIGEVKTVRITIPDYTRVNAVLVDFYDEYGDIDYFLYDSHVEGAASPEFSMKYSRHVRYRRFDRVLWTDEDEHYIWNMEFVEKNEIMEESAKRWLKENRSKRK